MPIKLYARKDMGDQVIDQPCWHRGGIRLRQCVEVIGAWQLHGVIQKQCRDARLAGCVAQDLLAQILGSFLMFGALFGVLWIILLRKEWATSRLQFDYGLSPGTISPLGKANGLIWGGLRRPITVKILSRKQSPRNLGGFSPFRN